MSSAPRILLATLALVATAALAPVPAHAAPLAGLLAIGDEASGRIDIDDYGPLAKHAASRTGHAAVSAAEVHAAEAALTPAQKAAYQKVVARLAGHSAAKGQLDALLAKHRLGYADAHGHSVLDNLLALATHPTLHGIDEATLLADTIADVCRPTTIGQAGHETCTATSLQAALARQNPAEYCRLVTGLATGKGEVTLKDGQLVLKSNDFIPFKDRSTSSNLMQPAIMAVESRNEGGRYDNRTDSSINPQTGEKWQGESNHDVSMVENAMLNGHYSTLLVNHDAARAKQALAIVKKATAKNPVLASITLKDGGGHEVQAVGFQNNQVKIRNPWGDYVFIPAKQFEAGVTGVNYRDR